MHKTKRLIPYELIVSANQGDVDAIQAVAAHYAGYIAALSTIVYCDCQGNYRKVIDETLKERLHTKLIAKIIKFKVA